MKRYALCSIVAVLLLDVAPSLPPAAFEPASLKVGTPSTLTSNGKPTIVVMFASWCVGCIEEFPTLLRDYDRFKDRVNFIGLDYLDSSVAGGAMVNKYQLPFTVFSSHPNADAPPPAQEGEQPKRFSLHLQGMPPSGLAQIIPGLEKQLPPEDIAIVKDVANACSHLDDASCRAYALAHGIDFGPAPNGMPSPRAAETAGTENYLTLPHLFVIDARGIVRADIEGYTRGQDDIARELSKLGIR
ncbi:MAG TPA: TlpA disulfide reductase family protein [Candidatus Acidoferrum sp.]|nr:TlpA disulfide reductase family protein [Candidatus Acidoferrum sp.]